MAATENAGPTAAEAAVAAPAPAPETTSWKPRYIDIGINLADPVFRGMHHGTRRHPDDLGAVIGRSAEVGCQKLIVTGSDLQSSRDALDLAAEYPGTVYTTAGIHPCSSAVFGATHPHQNTSDGHTPPCDPDPSQPQPEEVEPDEAKTASIIASLESLITDVRAAAAAARNSPQQQRIPIVALGEMGLDYDRLHYSPAGLQRHGFAAQLRLAARLDPPLPLFLHSRAAHADFVGLLRRELGPGLEALRGRAAVVHSFTGSAAELRELLELGLYVGINGCSLKTAENCDVVRELLAWEGEGGDGEKKRAGLNQFMLETDGPWCEIRPTHEGWKYLVEATKAAEPRAVGTGDTESTPASASEPPSGTSTPASIPIRGPPTPAPVPATSDPAAAQDPQQEQPQANQNQRPKKPLQQQQQSRKKQKPPAKKEPEVPERYRTVKKEKWVEGAMVKGRNEPCTIERVARAVAGIRASNSGSSSGFGSGKDIRAVERGVCEAAWRNTVAVFDVGDD